MEKMRNLDANESAFFARELETIKSKSYDIKYPQFKATTYIPVSTEAGDGADVITYQQFNQVGISKVISNYADDLPRADVFGKEFSSIVQTLGNSYGYNVQEVKAAQMAGRPLNQRKANSARRANDQKVDNIAWNGDAESGLIGLLTSPNIPSAVVPAGSTSGFVPWVGGSPKNPAEILQDMNDAVTRIIDNSLGVESPNTMLMPIEQLRKISTTRLDSGTDTTIKEFFMKNNAEITTIDWVNQLKDVSPAPSGGASPTDILLTYDRSPDVLTLEIPDPYQQMAVEPRGLEFLVPAHSRIGGVIVYYPLALDIAEGI